MLIFFTVNTVSCYVNNCMFAISDKIVINFLTILCVLFLFCVMLLRIIIFILSLCNL